MARSGVTSRRSTSTRTTASRSSRSVATATA
jgi:hypothetical protein